MASVEHDPLDPDQEVAAEAERQQVADLEVRRARDDLLWVLGDKRGRRFLWRLLERAELYRLSYSSSGTETAFREGRRAAGLQLLADLTAADPNAYVKMQQEHIEHGRRRADRAG